MVRFGVEYFDTAFIAKIYLQELGSEAIRTVVKKQDAIACSVHGRAELAFVFHRKYREGAITLQGMISRMSLVEEDTQRGLLQWLPIGDDVVEATWQSVIHLARQTSLRAADALHLVTARDNGFKRIFSNDRHLLAAAAQYGIQGCNLLP